MLGAQENAVRHMRALSHGEVASALQAVPASNARLVLKLAFEFLVLMAIRSGEVRWMLSTEIDQSGRARAGDQTDSLIRRTLSGAQWPSRRDR